MRCFGRRPSTCRAEVLSRRVRLQPSRHKPARRACLLHTTSAEARRSSKTEPVRGVREAVKVLAVLGVLEKLSNFENPANLAKSEHFPSDSVQRDVSERAPPHP